jgi:hypothetical protein
MTGAQASPELVYCASWLDRIAILRSYDEITSDVLSPVVFGGQVNYCINATDGGKDRSDDRFI